ncbi:hypothetical protein [Streptomyces sp. NBC_01614]|uniref:hypothetical protein n=1 Tax=Streptomyces sp. NBC_01614 TaxID=2975897 RepID=UPI0038688B9E
MDPARLPDALKVTNAAFKVWEGNPYIMPDFRDILRELTESFGCKDVQKAFVEYCQANRIDPDPDIKLAVYEGLKANIKRVAESQGLNPRSVQMVHLSRQRKEELGTRTAYLNWAKEEHDKTYAKNIEAAHKALNEKTFSPPSELDDPSPARDAVGKLYGQLESLGLFIDDLTSRHISASAEKSPECASWNIGEEPGLALYNDFVSARKTASHKDGTWSTLSQTVQQEVLFALDEVKRLVEEQEKPQDEDKLPDWKLWPKWERWLDEVDALVGRIFESVYPASALWDECLLQLDAAALLEYEFAAQSMALEGDEAAPLPDLPQPAQEERKRRAKARGKGYADPSRDKEFDREFEKHPKKNRDWVVTFRPTDEEREDNFLGQIVRAPAKGPHGQEAILTWGRDYAADSERGFVICEEKIYIFSLNAAFTRKKNGSLEYVNPITPALWENAPAEDGDVSQYCLIHHSSMSLGADVLAAGTLVFDDGGYIISVTDQSGHYVPGENATTRGTLWLQAKKLIGPETIIKLHEIEPKLKQKELARDRSKASRAHHRDLEEKLQKKAAERRAMAALKLKPEEYAEYQKAYAEYQKEYDDWSERSAQANRAAEGLDDDEADIHFAGVGKQPVPPPPPLDPGEEGVYEGVKKKEEEKEEEERPSRSLPSSRPRDRRRDAVELTNTWLLRSTPPSTRDDSPPGTRDTSPGTPPKKPEKKKGSSKFSFAILTGKKKKDEEEKKKKKKD